MDQDNSTQANALGSLNHTQEGSLGGSASAYGQENRIDNAWSQLRLQLSPINYLVTIKGSDFENWTEAEKDELLSKMA